jgi:hypothetical protein
MEQMSDLSPSEQSAWKQGFLFGFNSSSFEYEHELVAGNKIPYAAGTVEYTRWLEGYQSNLG